MVLASRTGGGVLLCVYGMIITDARKGLSDGRRATRPHNRHGDAEGKIKKVSAGQTLFRSKEVNVIEVKHNDL